MTPVRKLYTFSLWFVVNAKPRFVAQIWNSKGSLLWETCTVASQLFKCKTSVARKPQSLGIQEMRVPEIRILVSGLYPAAGQKGSRSRLFWTSREEKLNVGLCFCPWGCQVKWLLPPQCPAGVRLCRAALKELLRGQVFWCYQEGLITPRESI